MKTWRLTVNAEESPDLLMENRGERGRRVRRVEARRKKLVTGGEHEAKRRFKSKLVTY